jgi:hypothetical protein
LSDVYVFAHLGKIPVEEWLPFVVPVVALCVYVRRKERRRREALQRLPGVSEPLAASAVRRVLAEWLAGDYKGISQEHLLLLYPPGPDGTTPKELASRIRGDPDTVKRQFEDLADLGYLELEAPGDLEEAAGSWGGLEPRRAPQGLARGVT